MVLYKTWIDTNGFLTALGKYSKTNLVFPEQTDGVFVFWSFLDCRIVCTGYYWLYIREDKLFPSSCLFGFISCVMVFQSKKK